MQSQISDADLKRLTRSQITALQTVLEIQKSGHIPANYRQHFSTLVLRALNFDDLCIVIRALLSTIHLAQGAAKKAEAAL
jgi:hypothetical protein